MTAVSSAFRLALTTADLGISLSDEDIDALVALHTRVCEVHMAPQQVTVEKGPRKRSRTAYQCWLGREDKSDTTAWKVLSEEAKQVFVDQAEKEKVGVYWSGSRNQEGDQEEGDQDQAWISHCVPTLAF